MTVNLAKNWCDPQGTWAEEFSSVAEEQMEQTLDTTWLTQNWFGNNGVSW